MPKLSIRKVAEQGGSDLKAPKYVPLNDIHSSVFFPLFLPGPSTQLQFASEVSELQLHSSPCLVGLGWHGCVLWPDIDVKFMELTFALL